MSAINDSPASGTLRYMSDKMFLPFELNDLDHQYGNDNIYPDPNYFGSLNQYISCCKYFVESSFNSEIAKCLNKNQLRLNAWLSVFVDYILDIWTTIFSYCLCER